MKSLIATICILGLVGMVVGVAVSAATQGITATVTPKLIALTVSPGNFDYGVLGLNSEKSTKELGENQTVTNTGNVNEKIEVKTSNAAGGTAWTIGTVGTQDIFAHYWSANPGVESPTWTAWTAADAYAILNANLPHTTSNTQLLGLKIHTPTVTTDYQQKSITVTVLATEI